MSDPVHPYQADIENVNKISIVPHILDVVCKTTGMGFAAIARVTESKWIACQVKDDINFGLKPGGELVLETTICNEIRQHGNPVVINHVSEDDEFRFHHTPAMYGFQSYISVPIFRKDHSYFGTLCAIDPEPHDLKRPEVVAMFNLFADLISYHLETVERLQFSSVELEEQKQLADELQRQLKAHSKEIDAMDETLLKANKEIAELNYVSSHDLQEPLRKMQTYISRIEYALAKDEKTDIRPYFDKIKDSAERMQLLLNDLLSYARAEQSKKDFEVVDLHELLEEVIEDLQYEIIHKSADIQLLSTCPVRGITFQLRQLFHNLLSNSLKYAHAGRKPVITIEAHVEVDDSLTRSSVPVSNCHIRIRDNGIGFEAKYNTRIFELFQRLHNKHQYTGTGVGLALVQKIVDNHNGMITASGTPGEGAEFNIYLPAASA